jgi:multiple sugar transport system substrate-binding protein
MMRSLANITLVGLLLGCLIIPAVVSKQATHPEAAPSQLDRQPVTCWHFWGGAERAVVDEVVHRFNDSQESYFVRAVAMPGNNLDLKLFLSLAGGDPPDVVNIDDPVLADWAERNAILPLSSVANDGELQQLHAWLFPAARQLTTYQGQLFGLCNGLDVRALYYNQTLLDQQQLVPPTTIAELDHVADQLTNLKPSGDAGVDLGFLPNARNLWAWGIVFGGRFYDQPSQQVTLDTPEIAAALQWMASYGKRYGKLAASLRGRDQSLPGKTFPLLTGRYAMVVDGQWRARDIRRYQDARCDQGKTPHEFGVCALPAAEGQPKNAGWINGNYFVLPAGANNSQGAWEFMKFWSGFGGHERQAAITCQQGGWIPVSQQVVAQSSFQEYLTDVPLFAKFVQLAGSDQQIPRPNVPGAQRFDREIRQLAEVAMDPSNEQPLSGLLRQAELRIQRHIDFLRERDE